MSSTPPHDPKLIAILTAAATAALGRDVLITAVQAAPSPPPDDDTRPSPPGKAKP
ncbi:hypothetical protein [Algisphaera agarilytica]|uniref:Uncharacterized protein n=1 Tax=Algisphaera agarilytica TaxID=1385975 RepID=A0A7X0LJU6_9BACT|nr:hypothetical protein [Algisphaera agarilytica]MBB6429750.1 hypothetical protein [Algisphaera agarilytica]